MEQSSMAERIGFGEMEVGQTGFVRGMVLELKVYPIGGEKRAIERFSTTTPLNNAPVRKVTLLDVNDNPVPCLEVLVFPRRGEKPVSAGFYCIPADDIGNPPEIVIADFEVAGAE